jgi:hypothetical protein
MKKLLLVAAFAGMLGSTALAGTYGDDKKDKKESKKTEKACAGEKKEGCAKGEKSCCKKKAEASTASTEKETTKK